MTDIDGKTQSALPSQDLITLTHIIYALHAFSLFTGIITPAFLVTAFLFGWPSIIAVIINYVKRDNVRGTFLDSHFSWQIRTFWWSLLWISGMAITLAIWWGLATFTMIVPMMVAGVAFSFIVIPFAVFLGLWILYRIVRGWLALLGHNAVPD